MTRADPTPVASSRFFEACPEAVAVLDGSGSIQSVNRVWEQAMQQRQEEAVGRSLAERMHPHDHRWLPLNGAATQDAAPWDARWRGDDGVYRRMLWRVAPDPDEKEICFVVARDLERERERWMQWFRSEFINMAAHELNTPLTPVRLALEGLRMQAAPTLGQAGLRALELAERNMDRMARLVGDILDAARLHNCDLRLDRGPVDLASLVDAAVHANLPAAASVGVDLESEAMPDLVVEGDGRRLAHVLQHFVATALDLAPRGSTVHVTLSRDGDAAQVLVRHATPLLPKQRQRLFLPFTRPEDTAMMPKLDSGLGLYVSQGIIEMHGGKADAFSEEDGRGTLVFWLPLHKVDADQGEAGTRSGPLPAEPSVRRVRADRL